VRGRAWILSRGLWLNVSEGDHETFVKFFTAETRWSGLRCQVSGLRKTRGAAAYVEEVVVEDAENSECFRLSLFAFRLWLFASLVAEKAKPSSTAETPRRQERQERQEQRISYPGVPNSDKG